MPAASVRVLHVVTTAVQHTLEMMNIIPCDEISYQGEDILWGDSDVSQLVSQGAECSFERQSKRRA